MALLEDLLAGDRSALARAITLVESTRPADVTAAHELIRACLSHSGRSVRIGITGIPGAGKSTLIDPFGTELIDQGHRVAVLAIDPSSARSGGSILGDKTRMEDLAQQEHAFIRPSPTGGTLGGVGRRTRETIILCEAAGYDRILIETVGIGQSEHHVDRITDLNVLLMIGGAGDGLQGIKRGIMEAADVIAITKSEGTDRERNERNAADLRQAIRLLPPREHGAHPAVMLCSALEDRGVRELVQHVEERAATLNANGYLAQRRKEQERWWLRTSVEERLIGDFFQDPGVVEELARLEAEVLSGARSPFEAAEQLLRMRKE